MLIRGVTRHIFWRRAPKSSTNPLLHNRGSTINHKKKNKKNADRAYGKIPIFFPFLSSSSLSLPDTYQSLNFVTQDKKAPRVNGPADRQRCRETCLPFPIHTTQMLHVRTAVLQQVRGTTQNFRTARQTRHANMQGARTTSPCWTSAIISPRGGQRGGHWPIRCNTSENRTHGR